MVLSKDSLEALKDLEKFDVVQYGKAAVDVVQNPGTQFATFLDLPGGRTNWNRVFFDENSRLFAITSVHDTPGNPDKLVTVWKISQKGLKRKLKWLENLQNVTHPTEFNF